MIWQFYQKINQKKLINNEQYQDNNIEIYDVKREKQNSEKVKKKETQI